MKNLFLFLGVAIFSFGLAAQTLPTFSTGGNEVWYYIQFKNGSAVLQDMGDGTNLMTKALTTSDSQLWKVVGTQDSCEIVSKNGRHIYYTGASRGSSYRFASSTSRIGNLKLVSTTNSTYSPAWEIQNRTMPGYSMNQWSGTGADKELGSWDAYDPNNPLEFVLPSDIVITDMLPTTLVEYKYAASTSYNPSNLATLWYTKPTTSETVSNPWMDYALPIGNGQFGGMVYGGIHQDVLQFNEKTLWTGSSTVRGAYQNFGQLYIEEMCDSLFSTTLSAKAARNYYRQLDLETATASASWTNPAGTVTFKREYIASYPDQCIAIRLSASKPRCINNHFYLYNAVGGRPSYADGEGMFKGKLTAVSYNARMKVIPVGGSLTTDATGVTVKGADEVLVILAGGTDFDPVASGYISGTAELASKISARATVAGEKGWTELYNRHLSDYQPLFARVRLTLDEAVNSLPTNKLIDAYTTTTNKSTMFMLEQLYFHYGRYLLISSSRGVDSPANLQGIWNSSASPAWQSDIHSNINVQMNYWPAEVTNLPEMHEKFLNYVYDMAIVQPQWKQYARNSGQTTGWTCFTENNIFGHCTSFKNNYVIANAWYASHMWQHYRYTLDKEFLRAKAMPVMLSCTKFWMERLVKASDGTYECPKEWSPEHGPDSENATAHAQQLTWDLFRNTLDAINVLGIQEAGVDNDFMVELTNKFNNLDTGLGIETYKGTFGTTRNGVSTGNQILREWKYTDYATGNGSESAHRHLSHLMCLFPFNQISPSSSYFTPAVNAMNLRGDESTGWSMGWKINLWARALNGDHARALLKAALKHSTAYTVNMSAGGIYYNLFDSHSPFQIDGNFGACSGIAEMLLQSQNDTIQILPALPSIWKKGSVTGLRAINNFEVDQYWEEGKPIKIIIKSFSGRDCSVAYTNINKAVVVDAKGDTIKSEILNSNHIKFQTKEDGIYTIIMNPGDGTGITAVVAETSTKIAVEGRVVTVIGCNDIDRVTVYNVEGGEVLKTKSYSFLLPTTNNKVFIVEVKHTENKKRDIYKMTL